MLTKKSSKNEFVCDYCEKQYKSRVGLWQHKKNAAKIWVVVHTL